MIHIGVDEAGRGPMIGPLVVAAIGIPEQDLDILAEKNITDSKKLNPTKRKLAYELIEKNCDERGWKKDITICNPIDIDLAIEISNLNILETELFAETINNLNIDKSKGGKMILDACDVNEKRFGDKVSALVKEWPWNQWDLISIHRADSIHRVVGAASIVAKVTRDKIIQDIEKETGIKIGSGYPSDSISKTALHELCKNDSPSEHLRWNWASIRNYWNEFKGSNPPKRDFTNVTRNSSIQHRLSDY